LFANESLRYGDIVIAASITSEEFELFRKYIYDHAGIDLLPSKQVMVGSRLAKRLNYYQLDNYSQYFQFAMSVENRGELQMMVDILTTNETYFFREPKHFDYLRDNILSSWRGSNNCFRVWSAASSSGEEAYSLGMTLSESLGAREWEVLGTDLSTKVLNKAQQGVYLMERIDLLEQRLMEKYCLKGVRSQAGMFRVSDKLRQRTYFKQLNLMKPLPPQMDTFDVIFLRNVLIYFDNETKKKVVERIISALKPGGHFFISHSETLSRITDHLEMVQPSIYIKK
jgi:chemotaxis protein methyltransferase CheR